MTPTPKLRFVEREMLFDGGAGKPYAQTVRVLQQWFASEGSTTNEIHFELNGEWRDIPLEKEQ